MGLLEPLRAALGAACGRRHRAAQEEEEKAFWADLPSKESKEADEEEEEEQESLAFEQAVHFKDEGNEKFARGGDVNEAIQSWFRALESLLEAETKRLADEQQQRSSQVTTSKIQELRATLAVNLALGHRKLLQWRKCVNFCEEALAIQPNNIKALYRKADALGELCEWKEAEEVAVKLEETGEEGRKFASQMREEWKRKRKAAAGRQKKMWSAALAEKPGQTGSDSAAVKLEKTEKRDNEGGEVLEAWTAPKVENVSVFDLRRKDVQWAENEDFSDELWRDMLGMKEVTFYQKRALPLTLLAAFTLAQIDLRAELVVHLLLDGNVAPFNEPHDWNQVLERCPSVRSLTVIYVDIGTVGESPEGPPLMPYGTLLRPTEEGRVGDRVARAARFLGTYREFKEHCVDLPGLVDPHLALWTDVPLYGLGDKDFSTRLEAFDMLLAAGVPSAVTQCGEVGVGGAGPAHIPIDKQTNLCMAIMGVGLGALSRSSWWRNRFVLPLAEGERGVLCAHAFLGVAKPTGMGKERLKMAAVKDRLAKRGVTLMPFRIPEDHKKKQHDLRKRQWEAFAEKLRAEGRPVGPEASEQEQQRQTMEFYQFCGVSPPPPPPQR